MDVHKNLVKIIENENLFTKILDLLSIEDCCNLKRTCKYFFNKILSTNFSSKIANDRTLSIGYVCDFNPQLYYKFVNLNYDKFIDSPIIFYNNSKLDRNCFLNISANPSTTIKLGCREKKRTILTFNRIIYNQYNIKQLFITSSFNKEQLIYLKEFIDNLYTRSITTIIFDVCRWSKKVISPVTYERINLEGFINLKEICIIHANVYSYLYLSYIINSLPRKKNIRIKLSYDASNDKSECRSLRNMIYFVIQNNFFIGICDATPIGNHNVSNTILHLQPQLFYNIFHIDIHILNHLMLMDLSKKLRQLVNLEFLRIVVNDIGMYNFNNYFTKTNDIPPLIFHPSTVESKLKSLHVIYDYYDKNNNMLIDILDGIFFSFFQNCSNKIENLTLQSMNLLTCSRTTMLNTIFINLTYLRLTDIKDIEVNCLEQLINLKMFVCSGIDIIDIPCTVESILIEEYKKEYKKDISIYNDFITYIQNLNIFSKEYYINNEAIFNIDDKGTKGMLFFNNYFYAKKLLYIFLKK
uniref:F-box domain-containing protein n=1 Tax=Parastrongyloides trichosuri TaxID=131310 RepID=A0A0N4ZQ10_PARTI